MNLKSEPEPKNSDWKYIKETPTEVGNNILSSESRETPSAGPQLNYRMESSELDQYQNSGTGMSPTHEDSTEIKGDLNPAFSKPDLSFKE